MPNPKTIERREEIKSIIEELGIWNVPVSHLATKYAVSRPVIYKDLKHIIAHTPIEDINTISYGLQKVYKKALREAHKILADPTTPKREKLDAARTISFLMKNYTEMLESYGLKAKVADKVQMTGTMVGITIKDVIEAFERKEEIEELR